MDTAPQRKIALLERNADVKMGSELSEITQSNAVLSSNPEVKKIKKKKKNTKSSTDLEIMQHDTPEILCQNSDCREKPNESHNAVASNNTNQHLGEGDQCIVEGADVNSISTNKYDDCAQVDIDSCNVHDIRTTERKELGGTYQRKRRKTKPTEKFSGSVEGFPSVTTVPDNSAENSSLHGCAEKMIGGQGTPFLAGGDISPEKDSSECPNSKPAYREQEQKIQTENLEETINRQTLVEDVSHVGLPEKCFEKGNMDNLGVRRNAIIDVQSAKEICHKSTTSNEVCGGGPCVEKLESENLVMQLKVKDEMPPSLQLDDIKDAINSAVNEKGGLQQRFQLLPEGAAPTNLGKKLLVLDVNGLLADIGPYVSEGYAPDTIISRKAVFKRPFCDDFLQFCFEKFHVGVWSSRTKRNVESVLDFLMGKSKQNLLFCWDQSHCTDTGFNTVENRDKPLLLKELKKLWEKHESNLPWERGEYNESNTLLLDDSPYKALKNPRHTAIFPLSYQYKDVNDNSLGPNGALRVYLEGLALADNVQKYVELNPFGQRPITETNLSWGFYLKVIRTTSSIKQEDDTGCHKDLRNDRGNFYRK